jgi:hypothetical protein
MKDYFEELDKLEKYENVLYRINDDGFHYCFDSYSNFDEIEDSEFHRLREAYLKASRNLESYLAETINGLQNTLDTIDEEQNED